jgi:hypothetical protein
MTREETMQASAFQQMVDFIHPVMDIVSVLYIVVAAWFGMMVNNKLLESEKRQVETQTDIKEELTAHNAKNAADLQTHQAEDRLQFGSLRDGQTTMKTDLVNRLERIERKLDQNGRTT